MPVDTVAIIDGLKLPLERASEAKFGEVALLLEEIRDLPGIQQVLDHVRPRLVKARPRRKPNLQRLFYLPLEDLMVDGQASPGNGLLPRHLPAALWRHVVQSANNETRRQLETTLRRVKADDRAGQRAVARRLWPWVAGVLTELAAGPAKAARALGPDAALHAELIEIATLCQVADAIEILKEELPARPISPLGDEQMGLVRRVIARHAAGDPERTYVLVLAVMVRMAKPIDFLKSFMGLTLGLPASDRAQVFDRLARLIVSDVGCAARRLETVHRGDPIAVADGARALVAGFTAIEKTLRNDPGMRRQIGDARKIAKAAVTQLLDDVQGKVAAAVEIGAEAPYEILVETENGILALRKCQSFAAQIGLDRAVASLLGRIVAEVRRKVDTLFETIAGRAGRMRDRGTAMLELYWAVRMTELASNPDDADKLRREGLGLIG
ncbi:MAG TPA: hypothetical protein VGV37_01305 [Aliidongia sp.]|uniref:hypothetical protein n=1 Tax=Aliidongia sp. TaxID=1914230 RepID=UPI002DDD945E|nr:hypothetical protein [Aliidongia sp.]HEV2673145.1 hypothetical protein [Aliidongia sp.]